MFESPLMRIRRRVGADLEGASNDGFGDRLHGRDRDQSTEAGSLAGCASQPVAELVRGKPEAGDVE